MGRQYSANENTRFKTPMLRSGLCDYIVVKMRISLTGPNNANRRNKI